MRAHIPRVRSEAAASQRSSRAYPPNPLLVPPYTTTAAPGAASPRLAARTTGCVCQLSDRKRPRPASPESAIYLYVVPCQWFMPWGSEIRLSLCWCYAPCFAQKTPRGQRGH